MVNFGPLAAEIISLVWGTPGNFNGFRALAALPLSDRDDTLSYTPAYKDGINVTASDVDVRSFFLWQRWTRVSIEWYLTTDWFSSYICLVSTPTGTLTSRTRRNGIERYTLDLCITFCLMTAIFHVVLMIDRLPSVLWCRWLGGRKGIRPVILSGELLAWLSVCSEVQMICLWFSWCHCHPVISCGSKIQNGLPFWCRLTQVVVEKGR